MQYKMHDIKYRIHNGAEKYGHGAKRTKIKQKHGRQKDALHANLLKMAAENRIKECRSHFNFNLPSEILPPATYNE